MVITKWAEAEEGILILLSHMGASSDQTTNGKDMRGTDLIQEKKGLIVTLRYFTRWRLY